MVAQGMSPRQVRPADENSGEPNPPMEAGGVHVVHEVNQSLTAILTNAEAALRWLNRPQPDLDEVRQALERVVGNGRRAAEFVRSVRDQVRLASPSNASFDINDVIRDTLDLMIFDLRRRGIAVEADLARDVRPIRGDRVRFERVFANLVANGIDAMRAIERSRRLLRIGTRIDGRNVLVSVAEAGMGIGEDDAERIFEPMFTTKPDGTGLGLPICRSIVEAQGGRIWATANRPRGTVFRFTIPRRPPR